MSDGWRTGQKLALGAFGFLGGISAAAFGQILDNPLMLGGGLLLSLVGLCVFVLVAVVRNNQYRH